LRSSVSSKKRAAERRPYGLEGNEKEALQPSTMSRRGRGQSYAQGEEGRKGFHVIFLGRKGGTLKIGTSSTLKEAERTVSTDPFLSHRKSSKSGCFVEKRGKKASAKADPCSRGGKGKKRGAHSL